MRCVEQAPLGIIADAGYGHDTVEEDLEAWALHGQWMSCGLDASIRDGTHDLDGLRSPEALFGFQQIQALEGTGAADLGNREQETFGPSRVDRYRVHRLGEYDQTLHSLSIRNCPADCMGHIPGAVCSLDSSLANRCGRDCSFG